MNKSKEDKPSAFNERGVVNFSKYAVPNSLSGALSDETRVIACWIHVPKGSALGGKNNRIFMMGFPDDYSEIWTVVDQRLLNNEYWEHGSQAFGVDPETLYPVDTSLWTSLAMTASGFKVTFFDTRTPVGRIEGSTIYDTISINGLRAKYVGRSSGIDASEPEDLLLPTGDQDGYFLHYKIQDKHTVQDWAVASVEGERFSCSELLFGLAAPIAH